MHSLRTGSYRQQRRRGLLAAWGVSGAAVLVTLFPIWWIFTFSVKTPEEAFQSPPSFVFQPAFDAYAEVWGAAGFRDALLNSTMVVVLGIVLSLVVGVPAAFAMSRFRRRWHGRLRVWLLVAYLLPEFLYVIPMYVLYQETGLYDTVIGVALIYQVVALPLTVWLMQAFFDELPHELGDAAEVDGCTARQVLTKIYLPLAAPGIATTAILVGIFMWNELTIALALTFDEAKTTTVAVSDFRGYAAIKWDQMAAAAIIAMVPMLILAAAVQRYIVRGLTLGGVK